MEDLILSHPHGASAISDTPHLQHTTRNYKVRVVLHGKTSKPTVDTEQYSPNKEFQLRKWQQQDSWIQIAGEANDSVSGHTQVHLTEAARFFAIARERVPTRVDETTTQLKTETINCPDCCGKKMRRSTSQAKFGKKYRPGKVLAYFRMSKFTP